MRHTGLGEPAGAGVAHDQGSQFTSMAFMDVPEATGIRRSMDGRGYEAVYLHELEDGFAA